MKYVIGILFVDSICVIPFLTLRLEHRAKKFAAFKLINIIVNVLLNIFFISKMKMGVEAVFISNIIASLTSFILLIPIVTSHLKFKVRYDLLKRLLKFGLPYFPASLAAMMIRKL